MLQVDALAKLGGEMMGGGCYSRVYDVPSRPDMVLKIGRNDGTRNWLELSRNYCDRGMRMRGMPEVYMVGDAGYSDGGEPLYFALMRRYDYTAGSRNYGDATFNALLAPIEDDLADTFRAYMADIGIHKPYLWNDVHQGNVMMDAERNEWVITDPCACDYQRPSKEHLANFNLELS